MKIVYFNTTGTLGGAELDLVDIAAAVRGAHPDWSLTAVLGAEGPLRGALEDVGVPCVVLPMPENLTRLGDSGLKGWGGRLRLAARAPGAAWTMSTYLSELRSRFRLEGPNLVQTNDMKSHVLGVWSTSRHVPVVWYLQDYVSSRPVMSKLLRGARASRVVPVGMSHSVSADAGKALNGATRSTATETIHAAIDVDRFRPGDGDGAMLDRAAGREPAPPGTIRVGLVSTFARWKGHEVFIEAVARSSARSPHRFYVVGGPIYRSLGSQYSMDELLGVCDRLGVRDRVSFTGHLADPSAVMRALDVVVHASTRPEPFGRVVVEAMASGRALIAVGKDGPPGSGLLAGGSAELFEDEVSALAVAPGDSESLATAVDRLIDDSGLRARLGEAGRRHAVERFDRRRLADTWIPLYDRLGRVGAGAN